MDYLILAGIFLLTVAARAIPFIIGELLDRLRPDCPLEPYVLWSLNDLVMRYPNGTRYNINLDRRAHHTFSRAQAIDILITYPVPRRRPRRPAS